MLYYPSDLHIRMHAQECGILVLRYTKLAMQTVFIIPSLGVVCYEKEIQKT